MTPVTPHKMRKTITHHLAEKLNKFISKVQQNGVGPKLPRRKRKQHSSVAIKNNIKW